MEHKVSTARSDLLRMLADETAEPKALPLSLLEDITDGFSDEQEIGSGGFAVVYKGILGDRAVAVKRLSKAYIHEMEFHREIECLMRVKHKNVVRFLGYCADTQGNVAMYEGKFVMADVQQRLICFEYMPKGSLDKYITDASREWGTCYKIIKGICEGLQCLHDNHIVHLDLKPANILLDDNMAPKITDFGLSRCFDENQSQDITRTILGTMGYLAPEFREGGVIARSADLYSLGVTIIEILTGQRGYQAIGTVLGSWSDRLERSHGDTEHEQIRVCYDIGVECIDFNPEKRPASARNIIDRLNEMEITQNDFLIHPLMTKSWLYPAGGQMAEATDSTSGAVATESKGKINTDQLQSMAQLHLPAGQMVLLPRPADPGAAGSAVHSASHDGVTNTRSEVYYSLKLTSLKEVIVLVAIIHFLLNFLLLTLGLMVYSASHDGVTNTLSEVYYSLKLTFLKVVAAQVHTLIVLSVIIYFPWLHT